MLDVFFKEDIKNILRATLVASEGSAALIGELLSGSDLDQAAAGKLMYMYKQGFASAMGAIALAFGLDVPPPAQQWQISTPPRRQMAIRESNTTLPLDQDGLEQFDLDGFLWAKSEYERQRE